MTEQPTMSVTPCQHGNYACPLCDAPPAPRVPLIADDMEEGTPSARHFGAYLLGRAIGHADNMGDPAWSLNLLARGVGFTPAETNTAVVAYINLMEG